jgi:TetR/AcrR family transcriptional repressor of nem operon
MAKPNLREEILTAGLATLHGRGFNATSVQDITEAAGVPKGSFYNHFASKEDLGAAVV